MSSSRIVCDTNLLISAMIFPQSGAGRALDRLLISCELLTSDVALLELREVAARPKFDKYLHIFQRMDFVDRYARRSKTVIVTHNVIDCIDPKDNKFLELALSGNADAIISGDDHLLRLHPWRGIPILKPADYLARQT